MPVRIRKVKRFVIDVNCFVTIFINKEMRWLFKYTIQNNIEIFIDQNLIEELTRVLNYPRIKKYLPLRTSVYVNFVLLISTQITPDNFNIQCPDPEDNYLYNLSLSANAKLLVTGEKALLNWESTPIQVMTLTEFKEYFKN